MHTYYTSLFHLLNEKCLHRQPEMKYTSPHGMKVRCLPMRPSSGCLCPSAPPPWMAGLGGLGLPVLRASGELVLNGPGRRGSILHLSDGWQRFVNWSVGLLGDFLKPGVWAPFPPFVWPNPSSWEMLTSLNSITSQTTLRQLEILVTQFLQHKVVIESAFRIWLLWSLRQSAMRETWVSSLGWEDPLEKEMATHSSIPAWRVPWTEKPGGLQSTVLQESDTI